jgi:Holliday junction resolvase RusA-like endonuclease
MARLVCAFVYEGSAVAKARPRVRLQGGFARAYTPKKTRDFEAAIGAQALAAMRETSGLAAEEAVTVSIVITRGPLKAWSKRKAAEAIGEPAIGSRDIDNQAKAILDGLNGVAFLDDKQVCGLHVRRVWGRWDQIDVEVRAYPDVEQEAA